MATKNEKIIQEIAEYEMLISDKSVPADEKEFAREQVAELKAKLSSETPAKATAKAPAKPSFKTKKPVSKEVKEKVEKRKMEKRGAISDMSKSEFNTYLKKLSERPEYAFLKEYNYTKNEVMADMKRASKPIGWRFKGKSLAHPTASQIKSAKEGKRDDIYQENRPNHGDASPKAKFGRGGSTEIAFENSNLYLHGFGKDTNGNSVVKVGFPNQRAFSIQTNGVLPKTHSLKGTKLSELSSGDIASIEKEVVGYIKDNGSMAQKKSLKTYSGMMATGGGVEKSYKIFVTATKNGEKVSNTRIVNATSEEKAKKTLKEFLTKVGKYDKVEITEIIDISTLPPNKVMGYDKGGNMDSDEKLYKVVGKKNGQLVEISELPMTKEDCKKFIKKEGIENYYQNVDIVPYHGNKSRFKMARGGGLGSKSKYVPNRMITEISVERKGKETIIDGADVLDGMYVKKGTKFARGGGISPADKRITESVYDDMMGVLPPIMFDTLDGEKVRGFAVDEASDHKMIDGKMREVYSGYYELKEGEKYNYYAIGEYVYFDDKGDAFRYDKGSASASDEPSMAELIEEIVEEKGIPESVVETMIKEYNLTEDDVKDWFDEHYEGEYDSDEDLAYGYVDMVGGLDALGKQTLESYFDYSAFGRDLAINDFHEYDGHYFRYKRGGMMARGGGVTQEDKLLKELRKLQRELNSSRLSTYKEGDNSQEEQERQRERASKLKRFNDVLRLLHTIEERAPYQRGGGLGSKAKYIPNRMITEVSVERNGRETIIDGANILDGFYAKKGVKFASGGGVKKEKYLISFEDSNGYEIEKVVTKEELKLMTGVIDYTIVKKFAHGGTPEMDMDDDGVTRGFFDDEPYNYENGGGLRPIY
jgi:antirestriction protein